MKVFTVNQIDDSVQSYFNVCGIDKEYEICKENEYIRLDIDGINRSIYFWFDGEIEIHYAQENQTKIWKPLDIYDTMEFLFNGLKLQYIRLI